MPNIKSAKKRVAVAQRQHARNIAAKSAIKTAIKKFEVSIANGEAEQAQNEYRNVVKTLDKAVTKGFLHRNTVARKKSRLHKNLISINN